MWGLPSLTYAVDYLVPRLSRSFMDFVRAELEEKASVPAQRKPAPSSAREPVGSR